MEFNGETFCVCREDRPIISQTNNVELVNKSPVAVVVMLFIDDRLYEIKKLDSNQRIVLRDLPLGTYQFNIYYGPDAGKQNKMRSSISRYVGNYRLYIYNYNGYHQFLSVG